MVKAIEGTYENGVLTLEEEDPTNTKRKPSGLSHPGGVRLGSLAGKYSIPADFNAPLDDLRDYM